MSKYVSYCPYCGGQRIRPIYEETILFCRRCGSHEPLINLSREDTYETLIEEAKSVFGAGTMDNYQAIINQKYHIKDDPRYNQELDDYLTKKEDEEYEQTRQQHIAARQRAEEAAKPHCPTCGSTNIKKLDILDRAVSVGMFGLASNKINKSFKCKNCGHTW